MEETMVPIFTDEVKALNKVKMSVMKKLSEQSRLQSPSVQNGARRFNDNLDDAYIWLQQLDFVVHMTSGAGLQERVDQAATDGKIINMPAQGDPSNG